MGAPENRGTKDRPIGNNSVAVLLLMLCRLLTKKLKSV